VLYLFFARDIVEEDSASSAERIKLALGGTPFSSYGGVPEKKKNFGPTSVHFKGLVAPRVFV
jgi:hypothetical protein